MCTFRQRPVEPKSPLSIRAGGLGVKAVILTIRSGDLGLQPSIKSQLAKAKEILLCARPETTPVVMARQLGRSDEQVSIHSLGDLRPEDVDMLTVLIIGNSSSRVLDGRMVTPRGYPGAALN